MEKWLLQFVLFTIALCLLEAVSGENGGRKRRSKAEIEADIDEFVEGMRECYDIPGLSLSVLDDNTLYFSKGYGVKDLNSGDPFTNKTVIIIGSTTKAFAATVVGLAVNNAEGVTWNSPVRDILGDWFYLQEWYRSSKMTIRDLLSHQIGMMRNDHIRLYENTNRELIEKLRFLNLAEDWRDTYMYNNVLYGVASYVAETLEGGTEWEDLAREKLFQPLGMSSTNFAHQDEGRWPQYATGYREEEDGQLRKVTVEASVAYYGATSAAGAIASTAEDMAAWLLMQMKDGLNEEGEEVVPAEILQFTHTPATVNNDQASYNRPEYPVTFTHEKYALGWRMGYYREYKLILHGGARDGYRSFVSFLPDMDIGVFIGMNRVDVGPVRNLIFMYVVDLLLGEDPWLDLDTACEFRKTIDTDRDQSDAKGRKSGNTRPDEDYVGVYGHYAYGNASVFINETNGVLSVRYGPVEWTMEESSTDTFSAQGLEPYWYWTMTVVFYRDEDDVVNEMRLPFQSGDHPIFVRGLGMETAPPPPSECP